MFLLCLVLNIFDVLASLLLGDGCFSVATGSDLDCFGLKLVYLGVLLYKKRSVCLKF